MKKNIKKRLNWKGYILISIIISLILVLIFTLPGNSKLYKFDEWIKSVIISGLISIITSLIVSLIFTVQVDKQEYIRNLEKEIIDLFEWCFITHNKIYEINGNSAILSQYKSIMIQRIYDIKPKKYYIKLEYPEFATLFDQKFEYLRAKVDNININNSLIDIYHCYQEIANELLKVQEYFFQKYKGAPKEKVKDFLVFKEPINTKNNNKND